MFRTVGAVLILGLSFTTGAQAQPDTLTLACKGTLTTTSQSDTKPATISMGLIIDFTSKTVQGFGDIPVKITEVTDVSVWFFGQQNPSAPSINGGIDRVTGDVEATYVMHEPINFSAIYTLQCRPAQRMF